MTTQKAKGMSGPARKQHLKTLLHVGKKELGMDEETYRLMLVGVSKDPQRNSSSLLSLQELELAVDRMKASGFKVRATKKDRPQAGDDQSKKIRSLWLQLHDLGSVRDPSEKALASFVLGQTQVADLHWLSSKQAGALIERLKRWVARVQKPNEGKTV